MNNINNENSKKVIDIMSLLNRQEQNEFRISGEKLELSMHYHQLTSNILQMIDEKLLESYAEVLELPSWKILDYSSYIPFFINGGSQTLYDWLDCEPLDDEHYMNYYSSKDFSLILLLKIKILKETEPDLAKEICNYTLNSFDDSLNILCILKQDKFDAYIKELDFLKIMFKKSLETPTSNLKIATNKSVDLKDEVLGYFDCNPNVALGIRLLEKLNILGDLRTKFSESDNPAKSIAKIFYLFSKSNKENLEKTIQGTKPHKRRPNANALAVTNDTFERSYEFLEKIGCNKAFIKQLRANI